MTIPPELIAHPEPVAAIDPVARRGRRAAQGRGVRPARPRRTQRERTAETRARLLDATVECLVDKGYAGTTTTDVSHRARLSRGAQQHHFPTKASLVATAVEHLFERRREEFSRAMSELAAGTNRREAAIDLLAKIVSGRTFYAWLELLVVARTDPELRAAMAETSRRFFGEAVQSTFAELFPEQAASSSLITEFVFAALEGMALHRIVHEEQDEGSGVVAVLKALAPLIDRIGG